MRKSLLNLLTTTFDIHNRVQLKIEQALSTQLDFVGAFSFSKTYTDAPNPSLNIEGLGTVGVPLGIRDVEAIKSKAGQASLGKGGMASVDKSRRGVWEIDAKLVRPSLNRAKKYSLERDWNRSLLLTHSGKAS